MKKTFIISLIAIIFGGLFAIYVFKGINISLADSINDNNAYLYQIGVFRKYNNAYKLHDRYPESIIFKDETFYRVYIGISLDSEIQKRYEKYYQSNNIDYYKRKVKLSNKCLNKIKDYEKIVKKSMDESIYAQVNKKLLDFYQKECL